MPVRNKEGYSVGKKLLSVLEGGRREGTFFPWIDDYYTGAKLS